MSLGLLHHLLPRFLTFLLFQWRFCNWLLLLSAKRYRCWYLLCLIFWCFFTNRSPGNPSENIAFNGIINCIVFFALSFFEPCISLIFMLFYLYHLLIFLLHLNILCYLFSIKIKKPIIWSLLDIGIRYYMYII